MQNDKHAQNQEVSESASENSAGNSADSPELAALIEAWPTLPAAIRAGILAMVKAAI